jgi:iron-sulfur cluster repair protein YtfE (RIC family)
MTGAGEERNALLLELKWVHRLIRQDLQACQQLADEVARGATSGEVVAQLQSLQSRELLSKLGSGCLRHCQFVHAHHGAEDALLFPAVRRSSRDLDTVVDRLQADHRRVSDLLDAVESAAYELGSPDARDARQRLVDALAALAAQLLEHLAYEEQALAPVLLRWEHWPFYG